MGISEKVAYLKGLMEGMNLNADSNEGKLFLAIADVLDEIALEVEDLTDEVMELGDGLDVISDDLGDVEDIVYDDEDEDDYEDEEDDEDDEEECYATTCPECEEEIFFDDSVLEDGKVECPNCGEKHYIFGKSNLEQVAKDLDVKVLAQIPMDPAMATAMDQGAVESLEKNYLEPVADAILAHEKG